MHEFKAMNTTLHTWLLKKEKQDKVEQWFHFVENKLSRFKPDSELSQMNSSNGQPFLMSPLLFEIMNEAIRYYKETDGLFNPFMGHVIEGLGYRESFEKLATPSTRISDEPHQIEDTPYILDLRMKCITLQRGVQVDLGGIAKAWSANYMMKKLRQAGVVRGAINAGGDIVSWGAVEHDWEISIAHPLQHERDIVTVRAKHGFGIATSSRIKRKWQDQDGMLHHHLIDPRTQQSSTSDLIQVSVISSDLTIAEIVTKCVLLLGSASGISWFKEKYPELALIAVREDLTIIEAGDFSAYSIERNDKLE